MTVKSVWGRIQGMDATLTGQAGDQWTFQVPAWATSPIIVEMWAEDEAGNVSYRTGVFDLSDGPVKCIRWKDTGCSCVMLDTERPTVAMDAARPRVQMLNHVCMRMEA